jgi:integrase
MAVPERPSRADETAMLARKITEDVRSRALRRVGGELQPSVTRDTDIKGFGLVVTTRRAFWCLFFQPKGINPATGRRWGGGVRHELGDAFSTSIADARAAALKAKAIVRQGGDPHRQAMASRASAVGERAVLPTTLSEAVDAYSRAVMARREPSEASRQQSIHYARKAVRLLGAEALAPARLGAGAVRILVETAPGSAGERRHVFGALSRFLSWCKRQRLIEHNPCDDLERDERPKPGKARDHVPSVEQLRAVWTAAEDEPMRDLIRFLLLVPLRRDEGAGLLWSEVDLDKGRILIGAGRMKNRQPHELPLAPQALAILKGRKPGTGLVFPALAGKASDESSEAGRTGQGAERPELHAPRHPPLVRKSSGGPVRHRSPRSVPLPYAQGRTWRVSKIRPLA